MTALPRKTREEQSPFLYKREQGMKSKMYKQFFSDFDEKLKKLLLRKKILPLEQNKIYYGKMSRGRKLKHLPLQKVEVKSRKLLIYKAFSEFVH